MHVFSREPILSTQERLEQLQQLFDAPLPSVFGGAHNAAENPASANMHVHLAENDSVYILLRGEIEVRVNCVAMVRLVPCIVLTLVVMIPVSVWTSVLD